ncbi:polysaccharide deacetylase family protein [Microvirga makkahensis]|uniref:Chitooligosaccharide deacetylase n=1 Tax=Microvirga makkahensis TaxID=1128670 RepID=A0A7X3MTF7_9HYPH|nr:polysaccharide deacetylase family protein [Microvirga makkahensis]MXQ12894.1 polysaccharide deacetylase family protein [Microvirga makkahensis]
MQKPYGLMLHHFKDEKHPDGQGAITSDQFADIIEFMGPKNFLGPQEWIERAIKDRLEPSDRCITLDDALLCQYEVAAPVMESYGLTAFWFVYSSVFLGNIEPLEIYRYFRSVRYPDIDDFYTAFFDQLDASEYRAEFRAKTEGFNPATYLSGFSFYTDNDRKFRYVRDHVLGPTRYFEIMDQMIANDAGFSVQEAAKSLWMSDAHLIDLDRKGHVIGLHSFSHPTAMGALSREKQQEEYTRNYHHLSNVIGRPPMTMSHPCNSYNSDTLAVLDNLGVEIGFRANLEPSNASRYEYPRDDHAHVMQKMGLR